MRNKVWVAIIFLLLVFICIPDISTNAASGCCDPSLDCCCPDFDDIVGPLLVEYWCVCLDGKYIDGGCVYYYKPGGGDWWDGTPEY